MISKTSLLLALLALTSNCILAAPVDGVDHSKSDGQNGVQKRFLLLAAGGAAALVGTSKLYHRRFCKGKKKGFCKILEDTTQSFERFQSIDRRGGKVGDKCLCKSKDDSTMKYVCEKFDTALPETDANYKDYFDPARTVNWHCLMVKEEGGEGVAEGGEEGDEEEA